MRVSITRDTRNMHNKNTQGSLKEELGHLTAGLSKLAEASSTVDDLSKNAAKKQKELQAAQVTGDV